MEENGLEKARHSLCSQDLAPSDFYLFSHVKHCLRERTLETADELFLAIDAVWMGIEKWTLHAAFGDWMQRSGNVLRPMVIISRDLKKLRRRISFAR
jgi:hypothetical protein